MRTSDQLTNQLGVFDYRSDVSRKTTAETLFNTQRGLCASGGVDLLDGKTLDLAQKRVGKLFKRYGKTHKAHVTGKDP